MPNSFKTWPLIFILRILHGIEIFGGPSKNHYGEVRRQSTQWFRCCFKQLLTCGWVDEWMDQQLLTIAHFERMAQEN